MLFESIFTYKMCLSLSRFWSLRIIWGLLAHDSASWVIFHTWLLLCEVGELLGLHMLLDENILYPIVAWAPPIGRLRRIELSLGTDDGGLRRVLARRRHSVDQLLPFKRWLGAARVLTLSKDLELALSELLRLHVISKAILCFTVNWLE